MNHARVALFVVERDDDREWIYPFADQLGFQPVVPKRPSLALVIKAAPDLIVFDCDAGVPTQWVRLLQEIRETSLFESTPMLCVSVLQQLPAAVGELRHVGHLMKPFTFEEAVVQLQRLGISAPPRVERRQAAVGRAKSDKFRILDTPSLLEKDLKRGAGRLGCAVLYLDIDHFKQLNTVHLEREIDRSVLAPFQRLLTELVAGNGHVYAEGGDEVIILLPNANRRMAVAFAQTVLEATALSEFPVHGSTVKLTVSIGVAVARVGDDLLRLPEVANAAKRRAKEEGRNRVTLADAGVATAV
jgi:diguanylate cyclase (GGDEF)-like protein